MAERSVASVPDFTSGERLRAGSADPSGARDRLPPPFIDTTTQESGLRDTEGAAKQKLHGPFERAGGGRALRPTSPDSTAMKPTNKAGQPGAELVEPRAGTEGNAGQQSTRRAQNRESVALDRI